MILKGFLAVPNIPDRKGETLTAQKIKEKELYFNRYGMNVDVQHTLQFPGRVLESYTTDSEVEFLNRTYPKDSWAFMVEVDDDEVKQAIRNGEYTGFSLGSVPTKSVEEMRRGIPSRINKALGYDDVKDWKPFSAAIVDVPYHEWCVFEVYDDDEEYILKFASDKMVKDQKDDDTISINAIKELREMGILKSVEDEPPKEEPPKEEPPKDEDKYVTKEDLKEFGKTIVGEIKGYVDEKVEGKKPPADPDNEDPEMIKKFQEFKKEALAKDPENVDMIKKFQDIEKELGIEEDEEENDNEVKASQVLEVITKSLPLDQINNNEPPKSLEERMGRKNGMKT